MRCAIAIFVSIVLAVPAWADLPGAGASGSSDAVMRWISNYRAKPDPSRLPAAVRSLSQFGAFKDAESSGVYVGFIAGVLGANPSRAEELVGKMLSIPAADQWVIVRAIAYSGLPDWKGLMEKFAERMPARKVMIDKYVSGKLATLDRVPLEKRNPTLWDKLHGQITGQQPDPKEMTFDQNPELLDTLWGIYFATGHEPPIARIITLLAWSKERDSVDKLTVGSMAKYTLVNNAARDPTLLALLKRSRAQQPSEIAPVLKEVIEAAETMETTRVRKEALASIEDLKRKGPNSKREISTWGRVGQGALALGCIVAAVTGHIEFGLPCVIGGVASSAALQFWDGQP